MVYIIKSLEFFCFFSIVQEKIILESASWTGPAVFCCHQAARSYPKLLRWSHGREANMRLLHGNFKFPWLKDNDLILSVVGHRIKKKKGNSKYYSIPHVFISENICFWQESIWFMYEKSKRRLSTTALEHTGISKSPETSYFLGDVDEQEKREHLTPLESIF